MMPPSVFRIKSSMSDERPINYWKHSMKNEKAKAKSVVLKKERNFLNTIGSKNPRGINMIIFEMTWLIVKVSNSQLNGIRLRR